MKTHNYKSNVKDRGVIRITGAPKFEPLKTLSTTTIAMKLNTIFDTILTSNLPDFSRFCFCFQTLIDINQIQTSFLMKIKSIIIAIPRKM